MRLAASRQRSPLPRRMAWVEITTYPHNTASRRGIQAKAALLCSARHPMQNTPPAGCADAGWLTLRSRLWPHASDSEHLREMADALARGHLVRLPRAPGGSAMGFVEASRRVDYVNGTSSSPVAFLEGLYVEPTARRQGVGRALVAEVERWAAAQGCSELASDSPLENLAAHAVHRALGFDETERVVYFRRPVG